MYSRNTLYVGNISSRTTERDIKDEFGRYGRVIRCYIPPGKNICFVEYDDERDAEDAYRGMASARVDGNTLNLQWAKAGPSCILGTEYGGTTALPRGVMAAGVSVGRGVAATRAADLVVDAATVLGPGPIQGLGQAQGRPGLALVPPTVGQTAEIDVAPTRNLPGRMRTVAIAHLPQRLKTGSVRATSRDRGLLAEMSDPSAALGAALRRSMPAVPGTEVSPMRKPPSHEKLIIPSPAVPEAEASIGRAALEAAMLIALRIVWRRSIGVIVHVRGSEKRERSSRKSQEKLDTKSPRRSASRHSKSRDESTHRSASRREDSRDRSRQRSSSRRGDDDRKRSASRDKSESRQKSARRDESEEA
ncbi:hypothetical protein FOZ60_008688 [Perkinsus olseni]|uniref:RRM domain-containing protein n=1 Tax=Perkinsus olseni TaxID=32597 RepID=A0A7J6PEP1_PEROL|nr:hypothetical protein FOZ60_008688 [Perkinsus olseni]